MNKDKQIEQLAEDILQEFTSCYSEADKDCLERMIHDAWQIKQIKVLSEAKEIARIISDEAKNRADNENADFNYKCELRGMQIGALLVVKEISSRIAEEMLKGEEQ